MLSGPALKDKGRLLVAAYEELQKEITFQDLVIKILYCIWMKVMNENEWLCDGEMDIKTSL